MADANHLRTDSSASVPHCTDYDINQTSFPEPHVTSDGGSRNPRRSGPKGDASMRSRTPPLRTRRSQTSSDNISGRPARTVAVALDFNASGQPRRHASFAPPYYPSSPIFQCDVPKNTIRVVFYDTPYVLEHQHDEVEHNGDDQHDIDGTRSTKSVHTHTLVCDQCDSGAIVKVSR